MIDLDAIGDDILTILEHHGLQPENFGLAVTVSSAAFDRLFDNYPTLVDGRTVIINSTLKGVQATIQIRKRYSIPPELVTHPTP